MSYHHDELPVFGPDSTSKPLSRTYSQSDLSPGGGATSDAFPSSFPPSPPSPSPGVSSNYDSRSPSPLAPMVPTPVAPPGSIMNPPAPTRVAPPQKRHRSSLKSAVSASASVAASVAWGGTTYQDAEPLTRAKDDEEEGDSSLDDFNADSPEVDNEDDSDYEQPNPNVRRPRTQLGAAQLKHSPMVRGRRKSSVATLAKSLVRKTDPNHAFCLLTNAPMPSKGLQFCHVLPRATDDDTLKTLEYWFQMPYYTLYIDTHYNIFVLQATFHHPMDGGDWALVPHHKLIDSLTEWMDKVLRKDETGFNPTNRVAISKSYEGRLEFGYYFLALTKDMQQTAISRYTEIADPEHLENFDPRALTPYFHPTASTEIGELTSHIHPHFVVYAIGQKLARIRKDMGRMRFNRFVRSLATHACFGHEETENKSIEDANQASLQQIITLHAQWSSTMHVPKPTDTGSRARWLYHPDAPECKDLPEPAGWPTL
ncbi:hypothetical protein DFH06DRAFT_1482815 [Mycena polygramma]|nr:hypothetical protein DFH06DRAFT_1312013 [Mycena polygramma]KAJ7620020.1 hypothetical protein DFH06DRAFT_1482815 [Mycena polygramma]